MQKNKYLHFLVASDRLSGKRKQTEKSENVPHGYEVLL